MARASPLGHRAGPAAVSGSALSHPCAEFSPPASSPIARTWVIPPLRLLRLEPAPGLLLGALVPLRLCAPRNRAPLAARVYTSAVAPRATGPGLRRRSMARAVFRRSGRYSPAWLRACAQDGWPSAVGSSVCRNTAARSPPPCPCSRPLSVRLQTPAAGLRLPAPGRLPSPSARRQPDTRGRFPAIGNECAG